MYTVWTTEDGESYTVESLDRAYEIFDSEEHATIIKYRWTYGEYSEQLIDEK